MTGGATSTSSASQMGGFGIGSFISSGGIVENEQTMSTLRNDDESLPSTTAPSKTCKECGTVLPIKARFCSKCGTTCNELLVFLDVWYRRKQGIISELYSFGVDLQ